MERRGEVRRARVVSCPDLAATLAVTALSVQEGVREGDGCRYVIVVNLTPHEDLAALGLPSLPSNAAYVRHTNECYDWGTYAWALHEIPGLVVSQYTCAQCLEWDERCGRLCGHLCINARLAITTCP